MREDQRQRLIAVQEKLAEEALVEMDPDTWPGAGVPREEWNAKTRGDRNWSMKNANAAVTLLVNLKRLTEPTGAPVPSSEDEEKKEREAIAAAEAEAQEMLQRQAKNGRSNRAKH